MYKALPKCLDCQRHESVIDLRDIPANSYQSGDYIIGDLDEYGWMVVRGICVTDEQYKAIDRISTFGKQGRPTKTPMWHSIEERTNNRVMKYNHLSKPHDEWKNNPHTASFLSDLEKIVLGKALKIDKKRPTPREEATYTIGKYNLLLNKGFIGVDQQAYTDYPSRIRT